MVVFMMRLEEESKPKKLTNAVLVADSTVHPEGKIEVLQTFDEYIRSVSEGPIAELLKKYGHLGG